MKPEKNFPVHPRTRAAIPSAFYPWLLVALLWVVVMLNYLDRQTVYSLFPLIKAGLNVSDFQLGLLSTVFLWTYAIVSPASGYLADRWGRRKAILTSLLVWSSVTWATGHVHSFDSLAATRALMGISEACYLPAALALLADFHGERSLSTATALHQSGIYAGMVLGGAGGAWLGEHYGWQFAFRVFGAIGVLYALVLIPLLRARPAAAAGMNVHKLKLKVVLGELVAAQGFGAVVFAFCAYSVANWAIYTWLPTYLFERFSMKLAVAGFSATFYIQIASVLGILAGGRITDAWRRRQRRARLLMQVIGLAAAAPCLFVAGHTFSPALLIGSFLLFGIAKGFYDCNTMPVLCDLARSEIRATGYGVMNLCGSFAGGITAAATGALKGVIGVGAVFEIAGALLLISALPLLRVRFDGA